MPETVFQVQEVHTDQTRNAIVGETDWYEPGTTDTRELYKQWRREYGRCSGKMYQDSKDGKMYHVGYIFVARVPYGEDCMASNRRAGRRTAKAETYLCEMWCSWRTLKRDPQAAARGLAYLPLAEQYKEGRP